MSNPLMQEAVDRTRRTEAKLTSIMKFMGMDPVRDTRTSTGLVVYDHQSNKAVVTSPSATLGDITTELHDRGVKGSVDLWLLGVRWGTVNVA